MLVLSSVSIGPLELIIARPTKRGRHTCIAISLWRSGKIGRTLKKNVKLTYIKQVYNR